MPSSTLGLLRTATISASLIASCCLLLTKTIIEEIGVTILNLTSSEIEGFILEPLEVFLRLSCIDKS
ncbi:MAG: hypothetical protein O4965_03165 [Trichodesmium sp. St19_bin1]|nr:hypothetical protein [Trichodesmium sp. St19_bin1]